MLAALTACPGVFAAAIVDRAGKCVASDAPPQMQPIVDRAVSEFQNMLRGLDRTNPAWTSAFLTVEQVYVVTRRIDEVIVLVLARPAVKVEELTQAVESAIQASREELGRLALTGAGEPEPALPGFGDDFDDFDDLAAVSELDIEEIDIEDLEEIADHEMFLNADPITRELLREHGREQQSIAELRERLLELERQLEDTRALQRRMLPVRDTLEHPCADIAGYYRAVDVCSGDWWAVELLSGNRTLIVMGDVTGHGPAPAMITGIAKTAFDVTRWMAGDDVPSEAILTAMNEAIYQVARQDLLMSCVACVIYPDAGAEDDLFGGGGRTRDRAGWRRMRVTNAGHLFPLVVRHQDRHRRELREIITRGSPLGSSLEADLESVDVALAPGDVVLWYTDGLIECENEHYVQFGRKRLSRALKSERSRNPADLRGRILTSLDRFRGRRTPSDDITFAIACIK